jgi:hypothetical protein
MTKNNILTWIENIKKKKKKIEKTYKRTTLQEETCKTKCAHELLQAGVDE